MLIILSSTTDYCFLHLTLHEEPGCSSLEVLARLAEIDDESVRAGVSLPASLLLLHHHAVRLVLVPEWLTLIGPDQSRYWSLIGAGAKVYAITTHFKASKKFRPIRGILCLSVCCYGMISGFHAQKESVIDTIMP